MRYRILFFCTTLLLPIGLCLFSLPACASSESAPKNLNSSYPSKVKETPSTSKIIRGSSPKKIDAKKMKHVLAGNILKTFERRFQRSPKYKASFTQKITSKLFETTEESKGTLWVKKPDRFRWENHTDGSIQIFKDLEFTQIQPKAQRGKTVVDIYEDYTEYIDPKFLQFLTGRLKLSEHYKPTLLASKKDRDVLKLTPLKATKSGKAPTESYIAEIFKKSYVLATLSLDTPETVTVLDFQKIDPKAKVEEELFNFQPLEEMIVHRHGKRKK